METTAKPSTKDGRNIPRILLPSRYKNKRTERNNFAGAAPIEKPPSVGPAVPFSFTYLLTST